MAMLGLFAFFTAVWSGLRVSRALSHGAFDRPATCIDAGLLPREVAGTVKQQTIDWILTRQVWAYYNPETGNSIGRHLEMASIRWGWSLFWTQDQRRSIYNLFKPKLPICQGTLEYLKRSGDLTPEILAAARARYVSLNRPFPNLDPVNPVPN